DRLSKKGVEIRGCSQTQKFIKVKPATDSDWETEFLDLILAVRVVNSLDEAIAHIQKYSSGHSEAILTENYFNAKKFVENIDAAAVYVNASTRFTDGGQFGFGGEIGISTQRLHARGPVGLEGLTTYKYVILGDYNVRR
ncbi:aldehyde dehydrogenase family protein, partial [Kosmotoga sp.]